VLIGAPSSQKTFLFERSGTNWSAVAQFDCPGMVSGSMEIGSALALGEGSVYVGAPGDSTFGTSAGCVYVSLWDGSAWGQMARIGVQGSQSFGWKLAAYGKLLAVGVPYEANSAGATYLFGRAGSRWRQPQRLAPTSVAPSDQFGRSIAMHENTLLVDCPGDDVANPSTGIVQANKGSIHAYRVSVSLGGVIEVVGNGQPIVPGETRAKAARWCGLSPFRIQAMPRSP
jgi:hypothetical protein